MQNSTKRQVVEVILAFLFLVIVCILGYHYIPKNQPMVIDCRISEISPDIPIEAKELCRKVRAKNF